MSASDPLVSAVMPTFNNAAVIGETIDSIIRQTIPSWELIVVDDGSTDGTADVVQRYEDPRIRYVRQENQGRGAARNAAIRLARGKYIAVADSDDISLPDRFEKEVAFLEEHPEYAVVSGQVLHFTEGGCPKAVVRYPTEERLILDRFRRGTMGVSHAACMVRSEVFEALGFYCEECLRAQDLELFLRAGRDYRFANLEDDVLLYRNDPRSTTYRFWVYLHLYHEYAIYRSECWRNGDRPLPFVRWKRRPGPWARILTWHTIRYAKTTVQAYLKWLAKPTRLE